MYSWLCQPDTKRVTQPAATTPSNACPWEKPWNTLMAQGPKSTWAYVRAVAHTRAFTDTLCFQYVQPYSWVHCEALKASKRTFFIQKVCSSTCWQAAASMSQLLLCVPAACSWKDSVALAIVSTSVTWSVSVDVSDWVRVDLHVMVQKAWKWYTAD